MEDKEINEVPEKETEQTAAEENAVLPETADAPENSGEADAPADTEVQTSAKRSFLTAVKERSFRAGAFIYGKGILCFMISFLAPVLIMIYAFAQNDIHPFGADDPGGAYVNGKNQMLVVDLWHQYYPFFRVVREKLMTGGSFLYSWENGMGTNFLSLISYYAASPLNWLAVFFSDENVRDALTVILIAKIGFSGAFCSCFLRYTFKRTDLSVCLFSTMFALSSYTLGYYWNVMWFDTIALFPLVMLGIVAICRERKWKVFTFSLALSLISCYYIGYFTCIFCIFMFMAAGIIEPKGIKDFFVKLYIMVRSSVLGICLSAFMTLPAYFGLKLTYSAENTFPKDTLYYEKWNEIIADLLSFKEPVKVEGLPNIACGMLAVLLFGVFIFSLGIKIREKISVCVMLTLIVVSCNMNKLNFIWHGFHFTNQIPYRFAFIFSFVLVAAAYRAYDCMMKRGVSFMQVAFMPIAPAAVLYMKYMSDKESVKSAFDIGTGLGKFLVAAVVLTFVIAIIAAVMRKKGKSPLMLLPVLVGMWTVFYAVYHKSKTSVHPGMYTRLLDDYSKLEPVKASLSIVILYFIILASVKLVTIKNENIRSNITSAVLAAVLSCELMSNAVIGVHTVGNSDYNSYPDKGEQVEQLLGGIEKNEKDKFWRAEMTSTYTLNDSALYGYRGISQFSSAANVSATKFIKRLGMYASEAGNRYYYRISTPVVNSLLGVKYIMSKRGALQSEEWALDLREEKDHVYLYENKYPLSLGFMMSKAILTLDDEEKASPFEYQNEIMRLATGVQDNCFTAQPVALVEYKNLLVTKHGFGNYNFSKESGSQTGSAVYTYDAVDGSYLYGFASNGGCENLSVHCDDTAVDGDVVIRDYPIVFPMGNPSAGSRYTVEIFAKNDVQSGSYRLMIYALDKSVFEQAYERLADEQLNITKFSDTKIEGEITAKSDGILFLSMPYEKGWKVFVDGKQTETLEVANAMLGAKVSEGSHKITIKYVPEGFWRGVVISFSALAVCILIALLDIRRKRRAAAKEAAAAAEAAEKAAAEAAEKAAEEAQAAEVAKEIPIEEIIIGETPLTEERPVPADEIPEENDADTDAPEENDEKSQSDDSVQGD